MTPGSDACCDSCDNIDTHLQTLNRGELELDQKRLAHNITPPILQLSKIGGDHLSHTGQAVTPSNYLLMERLNIRSDFSFAWAAISFAELASLNARSAVDCAPLAAASA